MSKKRIIISLLIMVAMSILWVLITNLINCKMDYISWWGGVMFTTLGYLLGEWCSDE